MDELDIKMLRVKELRYLIEYARGMIDSELEADQLRCLWTAYCLHYRLQADTYGYDTDLMDIWQSLTIENQTPDCGDWSDFDSFDGFMCKFLV